VSVTETGEKFKLASVDTLENAKIETAYFLSNLTAA
jgi:hypothetical protein